MGAWWPAAESMSGRSGQAVATGKWDRPLQIAFMRYRELPVRIGSPDGPPAWLITIVDAFDGGFLGIRLEGHAPDELSLLRCLDFAIAPKHPGLKRYPGCKKAWDRSGAPKAMILSDPLGAAGAEMRERCGVKGIALHVERTMPSEFELLHAIDHALPLIASRAPEDSALTIGEAFLSKFVFQVAIDRVHPPSRR